MLVLVVVPLVVVPVEVVPVVEVPLVDVPEVLDPVVDVPVDDEVVAAVLAASSADLTRRAASADPKLGAALAPYPAWTSFATVMSADIARLNR